MDEQQPSVNKHYRSFWPIVIIAVLAFLVGGLLVYVTFNSQLDEELLSLVPGSQNAKRVKSENQAKKMSAEQAAALNSDSKTYVNEKYGFELTLTEALKNYKAGGVYGTSYSYVPFSVLDDRGYVDLFSILIYPSAEWYRLNPPGEKAVGEFIAERDGYVFSYQISQDPPNGIPNLIAEIKKVVSSFTFTK